MLTMKIKVKILEQLKPKTFKVHSFIIMLTNIAFVFICVRASSALVRTSAFLQQVVRGQVYIFEISPPLTTFLQSQRHKPC